MTAKPTAMRNAKIGPLQFLRAIAAMLVVFGHLTLYLKDKGKLADLRWIDYTMPLGELGVFTFFIISGFIMMHIHADDFGRGKTGSFFHKRLVRIVPIYWLVTTARLANDALQHQVKPLSVIIGSYFFIVLPNGQNEPLRPVLTQGWTLTYEMMFYVLFGLALLLPKRQGLALVVGGIVAAVAVGSLFKPLLDLSPMTTAPEFYLSPLMLLFVVGIIISALWDRLPVMRFAVAAPLSLVVLVSAGLLVAMGQVPEVLIRPLMFLVSGLAVILAVRSSHFDGVVAYIFERLGDASYALYLCHILLITLTGRILEKLHITSPGLIVAGALVAVVFGSLAIHRFVERPIMAFFRTLRKPDASQVHVAQASVEAPGGA